MKLQKSSILSTICLLNCDEKKISTYRFVLRNIVLKNTEFPAIHWNFNKVKDNFCNLKLLNCNHPIGSFLDCCCCTTFVCQIAMARTVDDHQDGNSKQKQSIIRLGETHLVVFIHPPKSFFSGLPLPLEVKSTAVRSRLVRVKRLT